MRTTQVGIGGRISRRLESELSETDLVRNTHQFLDALLSGFSDLASVADGSLIAPDLRKKSLLGSTVVLRVLAGVFHELVKEGREPGEVAAFFAKLDNQMSLPLPQGSPWLDTGVFQEGSSSPTSRRQDLEHLVDVIVEWAKQPPTWLPQP